MDKERLIAVLRRDEGVQSEPYEDSHGILKVGVGRNLEGIGISLRELSELAALRPLPFDSHSSLLSFLADSESDDGDFHFNWPEDFAVLFPEGLSDPQIDLLLNGDIDRCIRFAVFVFRDKPSHFFYFPPLVQEVVVNLIFNLGHVTFRKFKKAISAFLDRDWNRAADEILDSREARQTGQRYARLANVLRTQDPAGFELEGSANIS